MLIVRAVECAVANGFHIAESLEFVEADIGPDDVFRLNVIGKDYGVLVIAIFCKRSANCCGFFGNFDSVVAISSPDDVVVIRIHFLMVFDNDGVLVAIKGLDLAIIAISNKGSAIDRDLGIRSAFKRRMGIVFRGDDDDEA